MHSKILIRDGHVEDIRNAPTIVELDEFLTSNAPHENLRVSNDIDLEKIAFRLPHLKSIYVDFPSFSDGRGFSIARDLRQKYGFTGRLIADGNLIPDQYVFALQCGFNDVRLDEATINRHGESAWFEAMDDYIMTYQRGYAIKNGPEMSVSEVRSARESASDGDDPYYGFSAEAALRRALKTYEGRIVLASSLGVDSAVLLHMISKIQKDIPIVFLDTGKHFRETLHYRDLLISDLGLTNFINISPDEKDLKTLDADGELHKSDPDACCDIRKSKPLGKIIETYDARITGRKRYQTPDRANMSMIELNGRQIKVNPLAYWTAKDVTSYMRKHDLPPHPLLSLGFRSIGCQPCTTRVAEGEDPRAGRWRNQEKTECGIHFVDGQWVPRPAKTSFEVF